MLFTNQRVDSQTNLRFEKLKSKSNQKPKETEAEDERMIKTEQKCRREFILKMKEKGKERQYQLEL